MLSFGPYIDFYIEAIQKIWGVPSLGKAILCFLRPNHSTKCKTWGPELLLALQELSELTGLANGLNLIMRATKQRIDEMTERERLVTWMIAKDMEEAVKDANEEKLQRDQQEEQEKRVAENPQGTKLRRQNEDE
jgi:hypothetical protein